LVLRVLVLFNKFIQISGTSASIVLTDTDASIINSYEIGSAGNNFIINADGTERLRIDASGNVGIGTSSPQGKLNIVKGTASGTTASTSANNIVIDGTSGTETGITLFSTVGSGIRFGDASGASQGVIEYGHASDYMRFVTNAAEAMRIDSSGNVGIGTTSPSSDLHIASSLATIRLEDSDIAVTAQNVCALTHQATCWWVRLLRPVLHRVRS
jgi:hypothetical protein